MGGGGGGGGGRGGRAIYIYIYIFSLFPILKKKLNLLKYAKCTK